jgi:SAM-dependent methyltransferase
MRPETYQLLADREQTYWWHRSRRAMSLSLLRRYGLAFGCRWIDIGCGTGGNFRMLDSLSPALVVGVDLSPIAISLAQRHASSAVVVRADINESLPFGDGSFDVATFFNVLYHQWVRSETDVLIEAARVLRPGGLVLLTEPAFDILAREMDEAVMARRRYHNADFDAWLDTAGFDPLFSSYFSSFGVPILLAAKYWGRAKQRTAEQVAALDMRSLPEPVNKALEFAASIERWMLARGIRMPFGTTLVRVARRRAA